MQSLDIPMNHLKQASLPIPPAEFRQWVGNADLDRYLTVGRAFFEYFVDHCKLENHQSVLDIGCGSGRMARFLLPFLSKAGSYTGFDVWQEGVSWCQTNLENKFQCAQFTPADVQNDYINEFGKVKNTEWPFPCRDDSVDFTFATSVFTHIDFDIAVHYLNEIKRVLKINGKGLLTFFLIDEHALNFMANSKIYEQVKKHGPLYIGPPGKDVFVGWNKADLLACFAQTGLEVIEYTPGYWCDRKPNGTVHFQDIFLVQRKLIDR